MNDRGLRGSNLGARSLETDEGITAAPRQYINYHCEKGHITSVPMSTEADIPALWECHCGLMALRADTERPDEKPGKPARTHWDMLLERRTVSELEELLEERLGLLRSGVIGSGRKSTV